MRPPKAEVLVCQCLLGELQAALRDEGLSATPLRALPIRCHQPRRREPAPHPAAAATAADAPERIPLFGCEACLVGEATTGAPGLAAPLGQCFDLLIGEEHTQALEADGAYLVTPGWLAHWRQFVHAWGFDQATARACFAESATRVILLDTGTDPRSAAELTAFSEFVGLPAESRPTTLNLLRLALRRRLPPSPGSAQASPAGSAPEPERDLRHQLADYAMVYDLIGRIALARSEDDAVAATFDMFAMLMAPARMHYVPIVDGAAGVSVTMPPTPSPNAATRARLLALSRALAWHEREAALDLRIGDADAVVGLLAVESIALPQHATHYSNLSDILLRVSNLAIRNARNYDRLTKSVAALEAASAERERLIGELQTSLREVKTLSGLLPVCSACKSVRDDQGYWERVETYLAQHTEVMITHGMCPECMRRFYPEFVEE